MKQPNKPVKVLEEIPSKGMIIVEVTVMGTRLHSLLETGTLVMQLKDQRATVQGIMCWCLPDETMILLIIASAFNHNWAGLLVTVPLGPGRDKHRLN